MGFIHVNAPLSIKLSNACFIIGLIYWTDNKLSDLVCVYMGWDMVQIVHLEWFSSFSPSDNLASVENNLPLYYKSMMMTMTMDLG